MSEEKKETRPVQRPTDAKAKELQEAVRAVEAGKQEPAAKGTLAAGTDPRLALLRKVQRVQVRMAPIAKDGSGYGYRYATLGGILEALRPAFTELGLVAYSTTESVQVCGRPYERLTTYIADLDTGAEIHATHSWPLQAGASWPSDRERTQLLAKPNALAQVALPERDEWAYTPDPQKVGSYETYYRRYSLISLLNLPIRDDDGAAIVGRRQTGRPMPRPMNQRRD